MQLPPDSVIATYPEGETDSDFSYDEKSDPGDYSSTNTQEETVDEADIVKTDGTCIYAMDSKGTVRIVDAASMKLVGAINGENSCRLQRNVCGRKLSAVNPPADRIRHLQRRTEASVNE